MTEVPLTFACCCCCFRFSCCGDKSAGGAKQENFGMSLRGRPLRKETKEKGLFIIGGGGGYGVPNAKKLM